MQIRGQLGIIIVVNMISSVKIKSHAIRLQHEQRKLKRKRFRKGSKETFIKTASGFKFTRLRFDYIE